MSDYNGWANYATWRVNLEIVDDYVSSMVYDDAEVAKDWSRQDAYDLGQELHEYVNEILDMDESQEGSLLRSYAEAFLSDVNWTEIGNHAVDQAKEAVKSFDNDDALASIE